jgi:hypothetical protein
VDSRTAAQTFVDAYFPECEAAFFAGSTARAETTDVSDLDIIVIMPDGASSYIDYAKCYGWSIDLVVRNPTSYKEAFAANVEQRRPTIVHMCAEGIILKDPHGLASRIQAEASYILANGPAPLTEEDMRHFRQELTTLMDDFASSRQRETDLVYAPDLAASAVELIQIYHRHWMGKGKWVIRSLQEFDPHLKEHFVAALESFYKDNNKQPLLDFAQAALDLIGGRWIPEKVH